MTSKDDGLAPRTSPLETCPQCQTSMQHVMRDGKKVLECPNRCHGDSGKGSAAIGLKEPKEKLVNAR